jgi:hypothetical protein
MMGGSSTSSDATRQRARLDANQPCLSEQPPGIAICEWVDSLFSSRADQWKAPVLGKSSMDCAQNQKVCRRSLQREPSGPHRPARWRPRRCRHPQVWPRAERLSVADQNVFPRPGGRGFLQRRTETYGSTFSWDICDRKLGRIDTAGPMTFRPVAPQRVSTVTSAWAAFQQREPPLQAAPPC